MNLRHRTVPCTGANNSVCITARSGHINPFEPGCLTAADEQAQIIDKAPPALGARLSEDLLFDALWEPEVPYPREVADPSFTSATSAAH